MTFLVFFGFFAAVMLLGSVTVAAGIIALNTLGKYNIGGVPVTSGIRIATCIFLAVVGWAWYLLLTNAPFTVTINA